MCLRHPLEEASDKAPAKTHFQGPKGTEMLFAGIAFVNVNDSGVSVSGNPPGELVSIFCVFSGTVAHAILFNPHGNLFLRQ